MNYCVTEGGMVIRDACDGELLKLIQYTDPWRDCQAPASARSRGTASSRPGVEEAGISHSRLNPVKTLYNFFEQDHRRLEELFAKATSDPANFDMQAYAEFRKGILRHIAMEEKFVIPAILAARGGAPLHIARQLRFEHGAIAALLVPPPGKGVIETLKKVLAHHHQLEEGTGGLYESCERYAAAEASKVLEKSEGLPEVPVLPHNPSPVAYEAAIRTLARAGYTVTENELRA